MSYEFKVGDKVQRLSQYRDELGWPHGDKIVRVTGIKSGHLLFDDEFSGGWMAERFLLVQTFVTPPTARSNDPATSKRAARKSRVSLRDRIVDLMNSPRPYGPGGWTGQEVAEYLDARLNSVTPRFSELRREGKIKDSGVIRDGQIAWVLA